MYIPNRFTMSIDSHMLGNLLGFPRHPLLLAVVGNPGMGKTYQLREYLKQTGVKIISISADEFENENAGRPAKLIKQKYVEASAIISTKKSAVLVIDDIDTTLGEWENNTGTVNHQDILCELPDSLTLNHVSAHQKVNTMAAKEPYASLKNQNINLSSSFLHEDCDDIGSGN